MYESTLTRNSVSFSLNDTAANTKEQTGGRKRWGTATWLVGGAFKKN